MTKKKSGSAWRRFRSPCKPKSIVATNIPIDRMSEFTDQEKAAVGRLAHEAWEKELKLKRSQGPHSTPEPHYPKSIFLKKEEP